MNFVYRRSWIFAGLILIVLNACSSGPVDTPASLQTEAPTMPTAVPIENVFGPGTFTLELPSGWDIFGPEVVNSDPNQPYDLYLLGENPTEDHGPSASRVVIDRAAKWTPEEFVLSQCSTCPDNGFESVALAGTPALRTQIGGGGVPFTITWYFVERQGNFIAFALHDPQTLLPLAEVIETIQFE